MHPPKLTPADVNCTVCGKSWANHGFPCELPHGFNSPGTAAAPPSTIDYQRPWLDASGRLFKWNADSERWIEQLPPPQTAPPEANFLSAAELALIISCAHDNTPLPADMVNKLCAHIWALENKIKIYENNH